MTWLLLGVVSLATYRVARLVAVDSLSADLRRWVARRWPPFAVTEEYDETGQPQPGASVIEASLPVKLIHCVWCLSVWVALGAALGVHFAGLLPSWQWTVLLWLGASTGAGLCDSVVSRLAR